MSLTVKNTQRVVFVVNLHHNTKVEQDGPYAPTPFSMHSTIETRAGGSEEQGVRIIEKKLPASITWLPGETKTDLPEGLLEIDEFKRARQTRKLVLLAGGNVKASAAQERVPGEPKQYDADRDGAAHTTTSPSGEKA